MSDQPTDAPILIIWSNPGPGIRSTARTLAGLLSSDPHRLPVVEADLPELLAGRSLLQSLASWVAGRVETAVVASLGWQALEPQLRERPPRLVVALDPVAASAVDSWRSKGLVRAPLLGICCGLRLDPAWGRTAVERLSVADTVQAEAALQLGLPAEILVPCGIPVCGGFSSVSPDEKEAHRRRFALPLEKPLILVVTHGLSEDELTGALFQLSMVTDRATLLFDVARDDEGAELLRRRAGLYGVAAQMFGKVEEAAYLWGASTMVIARPHLYVEQRALALRLPLIALLPQGAEERETAAAWVSRRIGRTVEHLSTLAAEVDLQLTALEAARVAMAEITRRSAAPDLARFVAQARAESEQLLAEASQRLAAPGPAAAPARRSGPLEAIGPSADPDASPPESLEDLEAAEAEANRQVTEHQQEVDRWTRRVGLARDRGEADLVAAAEREGERHQAAMHRALAELGRLSARRLAAKRTRDSAASAKVDRDFRKLEIDEALEALKRKLD